MEIVGLKNFVQDDVNKLIAKFVGFKTQTAKLIETECKRHWAWEEIIKAHLLRDGFNNYVPKDASSYLKEHAGYRLDIIINRKFYKIREIRKITERRDAFTKLRPWLRKFLIAYNCRYGGLLPNNGKNQRFIEEQMAELKMKRVNVPWNSVEW